MIYNRVYRDGNRIIVQGELRIVDMHRPLAGIHQCLEKGFQEVVLDFTGCSAAFAGPMLALCAQVIRRRSSGIDFILELPQDSKLARLFLNSNWAYFLEPNKYDLSLFKGHTHIPATRFQSPEEQQRAVNRIVNAILGALPDIERKDFAAFEWSLNEITDNVLTHAQSNIGGLVQVSMFHKASRRIEYIVADAGLGIPTTLRGTHPEITSDTDALDKSIREGFTRDKSVGQGNGLFGSYQICSHSHGLFQMESGYGKLSFENKKGLQISLEAVPYQGTLIAATMDFSNPGLLQEALKFGGKLHTPIDFIETHYKTNFAEDLRFIMTKESESFGSRIAGTPIRSKLVNLMKMCPGQKIYVDFAGVPLVSSSFADEVFGKLFVELGALIFIQRFEFRNVCETVRQIMDLSIAQRSLVGRVTPAD